MVAKQGKGKPIDEREPRAVAPFVVLDPAHLALPDEEIRRLVLRITTAGNVAPFVRRMVRFIDSLKTDRPIHVARVARRSANLDLVTLVSAMSRAVEEKRFSAAYLTAFLAAHYAYQNSLDYVCALTGYMDSFRRK
jgi:hypothetical protein